MSIKLPHKLAPWEPQLRIFPEQIALALGPLIQKVAALLGPFAHHHAEGHVAPDGFAGLAKRGSYERLIASDWLLADELPEEFMRRSVMGEHLFWKVAYREPSQTRRSLVLFDAGPEQLGSPRLLHLAALAVFDARARMAKANFSWGILQSSDLGLLPGINFAEVEMLLEARGSVSAQAEHFTAWTQRASETDTGGEIWVVGSERLRQFLPKTFSALLITDLLSPGARKLRAECRPAGKHSRHIELELPEPNSCAQLLRDPFSTTTAPLLRLETSALASLVFSPSGNKLFAPTELGKVLVLPVPNSPRDIVGNPRQFQSLSRLPYVAVGRIRRTTVFVSMNPVSLAFSIERFGKALPQGLRDGEHAFYLPGTRPLIRHGGLSLCIWHDVANQRPGLYFLDEAGTLLRLFTDQNSMRWCKVMHPRALALTRTGSAMCYAVYEEPDGVGQVRVSLGDRSAPVQSWPSSQAPCQAFFGYGSVSDNLLFGLLAVNYTGNMIPCIQVCSRTRRWDKIIAPGCH